MTNTIPIDRAGKPATASQTAAGAFLAGVYHPSVLPWEGHPEDILCGRGRAWYRSPWVVAAVLGMAAGIVAAVLS
jgi:hypothetical protein